MVESAEKAASQGSWDEVRRLVVRGLACVDRGEVDQEFVPLARRVLHRLGLRSAAFWWRPLTSPGLTLRRTSAEDTSFYRSCFDDRLFAAQFNRQVGWRGDLKDALASAGSMSPLDLGSVVWIVCDKHGRKLGLAALSSLDPQNSKAEFSVGFPGRPFGAYGVGATLLAYHFAFFVLRLNKIYALIYESNQSAMHNATRLGFHYEGLLRDFFFLPPGEFVSVHALGLTRGQLLNSAALVALAHRRIGVKWSCESKSLPRSSSPAS